MSYAITSDCAQCGVCVFACPEGAIVEVEGEFVIDAASCTECAECVAHCPSRAIVLRDAEKARARVPASPS